MVAKYVRTAMAVDKLNLLDIEITNSELTEKELLLNLYIVIYEELKAEFDFQDGATVVIDNCVYNITIAPSDIPIFKGRTTIQLSF